ncbi:MAG: NAD(P) transhydrogenase subunit alpha, partial [Rhodospirillales bacterium]
MKIAIPKERRPGERRVASSPEVVKKLSGLGFDVVVEQDAGAGAFYSDAAFRGAGALIVKNAAAALKDADIVLKVRRPILEGGEDSDELSKMKKGAILIANLGALGNPKDVEAYAAAGITAFAMELMPRISRAQSMDVLSSQSNLSGYKAVLDAASEFGRVFPMMMTAAGTVAPAKVFIMGVGVAGLQAIATAKRLGAVVTATDVRPATKEQVESLGGKFLVIDPEMEKDAQTEGGYAKEMPPEYFQKQKEVVAEHIKKQDIVITTALVPGRPAPVLVSEKMVKSMMPG